VGFAATPAAVPEPVGPAPVVKANPGGDDPAVGEIRAGQLQEDLLALETMGSEAATRVLAELSPRTLRRISTATRVDWLPAELNVELAHAGLRVLGEAGLQRWGRASVVRSMRFSLLRPIAQGAIGLFGLSPGAFFRTVPAAYRAAYRGCGEMTVSEPAERVRHVTLAGVPPVLRDRPFLVALAGALEGVFDVCEVEGSARLASEPGERVEFEARWP
jgi:hypothetical protein